MIWRRACPGYRFAPIWPKTSESGFPISRETNRCRVFAETPKRRTHSGRRTNSRSPANALPSALHPVLQIQLSTSAVAKAADVQTMLIERFLLARLTVALKCFCLAVSWNAWRDLAYARACACARTHCTWSKPAPDKVARSYRSIMKTVAE